MGRIDGRAGFSLAAVSNMLNHLACRRVDDGKAFTALNFGPRSIDQHRSLLLITFPEKPCQKMCRELTANASLEAAYSLK
jgi:hypothetical protein